MREILLFPWPVVWLPPREAEVRALVSLFWPDKTIQDKTLDNERFKYDSYLTLIAWGRPSRVCLSSCSRPGRHSSCRRMSRRPKHPEYGWKWLNVRLKRFYLKHVEAVSKVGPPLRFSLGIQSEGEQLKVPDDSHSQEQPCIIAFTSSINFPEYLFYLR